MANSSVISLQYACLQPMLVVCKWHTLPLCADSCVVILSCFPIMKESLSGEFLVENFQNCLDSNIFDTKYDSTRLGNGGQPAWVKSAMISMSSHLQFPLYQLQPFMIFNRSI